MSVVFFCDFRYVLTLTHLVLTPPLPLLVTFFSFLIFQLFLFIFIECYRLILYQCYRYAYDSTIEWGHLRGGGVGRLYIHRLPASAARSFIFIDWFQYLFPSLFVLYCTAYQSLYLSVLEDRFSIFAQHAICHFVLCVLTLWTFTSILVPILNAQRSYSSSNLNLSRMLIGNVV